MARGDVAAVVAGAPVWRPQAVEEGDPLDFRLAWENLNDLGNARRLLQRHGDDLIYVRDVGWHWWDGRRWDGEEGETKAQKLAHATATAVFDEVKALQDAPKDRGVDRDQIDRHFKWAVQSGNAARLAAMLNVARPNVTVAPAELDANPVLLNLANGTMPLEGSCEELRPHDRGDLITKIIDVEFDPAATCPTFDAFVEEILPDAEVRLFVQRSLGYALTGLIGEQCLWIFYGTGANGKSTLVDIVARILGPYSQSLPFSSLTLDERKRGAEATPDLARLPGARLVRASEPEKGAKLGESTVKMLTGGEPITVRHLNQGFFEVVPTFKLFLSVNHKPQVRGQDHGVWRRIKLVPFTVTIPDERKDQSLGDKLWAERAGILNWLLDGCRMWLDGGLRPPEAVAAATQDYREDQDPLGLFLANWTERIDGAAVQGKRLHDAYKVWCGDNGFEPINPTLFGRMLSERGLSKAKVGVVQYLGLQLTEEASLRLDEASQRRGHHHGSRDDDG